MPQLHIRTSTFVCGRGTLAGNGCDQAVASRAQTQAGQVDFCRGRAEAWVTPAACCRCVNSLWVWATRLGHGGLDMIWFDAKSEHGTLADFLLEYWPLLNPDGGVLMVHFTAGYDTHAGKWWLIDIKGLIMKLGLDRGPGIQQLQLIEPHKYRQGAVTMIRRPRARPSLALPLSSCSQLPLDVQIGRHRGQICQDGGSPDGDTPSLQERPQAPCAACGPGRPPGRRAVTRDVHRVSISTSIDIDTLTRTLTKRSTTIDTTCMTQLGLKLGLG